MNPTSFKAHGFSSAAFYPQDKRELPQKPLAALNQPQDTVLFGLSAQSLLSPAPKAPISLSGDALELQLRQPLKVLYGSELMAFNVAKELRNEVELVRNARSPELLAQDVERIKNPTWYKQEVLYCVYPDRLGVKDNGEPNTFKDFKKALPYLKSLGVTTLYMTPFLESPQVDAGFDVSDYNHVRKDLGGDEEFADFWKEAKDQGFKFKMDMVLNHTSDQHSWFKEAVNGNEEKRNYYLFRDEKPTIIGKKNDAGGKIIKYREELPPASGSTLEKAFKKPYFQLVSLIKGTRSSARREIFDNKSPDGHWNEITINGKKRWYYSTFYKQQPDLNWKNPEVMKNAVKIMGEWANRGVDIFRLDALAFYAKNPGANGGENTPQTHAITQVISTCLQAMAPSTILLGEVCQKPEETLQYYGKDRTVNVDIKGHGTQSLTRSDKIQMGYNFDKTSYIWASMLTQNAGIFNERLKLQARHPLPPSAINTLFLRGHDEFTAEAEEPKIQKTMLDALRKQGEPFRLTGIGGRKANFLHNDVQRINLMDSLLLSQPDVPSLYYGDEIGAQNDGIFMKKAEAKRGQLDGRDLGRGLIKLSDMEAAMKDAENPEPQTMGGKIFKANKQMIALRKSNPALSTGRMTSISATSPSTLSYLRELGNERILIIHNLSNEPTAPTLKLPAQAAFSLAQKKDNLEDLITRTHVEPLSSYGDKLHLRMEPYQTLWIKL